MPSRQWAWAMLALAWLVYAYFGAMASSLAPILPLIEPISESVPPRAACCSAPIPLLYVAAWFAVGRLSDSFGVKRSVAVGLAH